MRTARIFVSPKKSILDPQGKAVRHALESLGFQRIQEVRIGKYIELKLDQEDSGEVEETVKKMCEALLVNSLIEEYTLEINPDEGHTEE